MWHGSNLQALAAFISAEAELYSLNQGECMAMGAQAYLADWGFHRPLIAYTDASGAKALTERRGLGKLRHISARFLWMQERVSMRHLSLRKVAGLENFADAMTKALSKPMADKLHDDLCLTFEARPAWLTPRSNP